MREICNDLTAEHDDLDNIVAGLDENEWSTDTPSPGWAVRDQISHLWFFDQRALMALTDPEAFVDDVQWLLANGGTDASVEPGRSMGSVTAATRARGPSAVGPCRGRHRSVHSRLVRPADGGTIVHHRG
jgi:hypothetical protein